MHNSENHQTCHSKIPNGILVKETCLDNEPAKPSQTLPDETRNNIDYRKDEEVKKNKTELISDAVDV